MKKRVYSVMDDAVYRVIIRTEDWSHGDVDLMVQFGEPEVNVGGTFSYVCDGNGVAKSFNGDSMSSRTFGDEFVRLLHGFPYMRAFDSRDYGSVCCAVAAGNAWKDMVLGRIDDQVRELRSKQAPLPTEEVSEI